MSFGGIGLPRGFNNFSAENLSNVYTYGQFVIPAGSMTPNIGQGAIIETYQPPTNAYHTFTVLKYAPSVDREACFTFAFKADFVAVPTASMLLKAYPVWFVKNTDAGKKVQWSISAVNCLIGSSIDISGSSSEVEMLQTVKGNKILNGGIVANDQAGIALSVGNDTLSATNLNNLFFEVEREGTDANDNFLDDAFLHSIVLQYRTNFGNISVWPTS